ncbi:MAG: efflux RND transporter periplasmic adaptor subunit [Sedimentisphaerales bacterium]|nr:efflux RND transporter periplasmic adaptor subunit [Sedimentisphaerales bacterium]
MVFQLKNGRLLNRALPVLVWIVSLAFVVFLFQQQSVKVELKGIAFSFEQIINTTETGYLRSVPVTLYQQVKKGDTLAVIKENTVAREEYINALLQAQQETAESELEQLKAELEAAEDRLLVTQFEQNNDIKAMERRLAVDMERARLEVLDIKSTLEPDRLTLKDLEVEIEIVKSLIKEHAAEAYELQKAQSQYDILKETVTQTEQLLAQAQKNYESAQLRKDEFDQTIPFSPQLSDKELAPLRKAILVQENRVNEFIKQQDIIVLTAPFDGIISTLNCYAGQTVVRGDAIMTIIKPTPEFITAWVPQKGMERFSQNTKVEVISQNSNRQSFVSQVSNISPSVELIPQRLWQNPTIPEWGRAIQIPIQPNFVCTHNEIVGIKTIL